MIIDRFYKNKQQQNNNSKKQQQEIVHFTVKSILFHVFNKRSTTAPPAPNKKGIVKKSDLSTMLS